MQYRILSPQLHSSADQVVRYFRRHHGASSLEVEVPVWPGGKLKPTVVGKLPDHHILCVEVNEAGYIDSLDAFVLDCSREGLPVKFYIAMPRESGKTTFKDTIRLARARGVGIIDIHGEDCEVLIAPVSLSLVNVQRIQINRFPVRYRHALEEAQATFLNGDPAKGCSRVYDELENISKRIAAKLQLKHPALLGGADTYKISWAAVLKALATVANPKLNGLNDALIGSLLGITPYRNESGHKPKSKAELVRRDRQLRTRFEISVNILEDLAKAAKVAGV
jgi:hypothetical protein